MARQASALRLIRTLYRLAELAAIVRSSSLVLTDRLVEGALAANGRDDDIPQDFVWPFNRGALRHRTAVRSCRDAAKVRQKLVLDPVLNFGVNGAVHHHGVPAARRMAFL